MNANHVANVIAWVMYILVCITFAAYHNIVLIWIFTTVLVTVSTFFATRWIYLQKAEKAYDVLNKLLDDLKN